ncbi:MAG: hypothetical protein QG567_2005 [Campylobacterota bacterium]|nr:hypothetical protein [Campylobacterota bacterium]
MKNRRRETVRILTIFLIIVSFGFQGCSRELRPSPYYIHISTNPSGAIVQANKSTNRCVTPCDMNLSSEDHRLIVYKDGYITKNIELESRYSTSEAVGVVLLSVVGVVGIGTVIYLYVNELLGNVVVYGGAGALAGVYPALKVQKKDVNISLDK